MTNSKTKGAPLVARVVHWAMAKRRQGGPDMVTSEVVNLLVALAERHNAKERCARPGNLVLARDTGFTTKDTIRRWLRDAETLGAITFTPGQGRGHATEVRFTDDVLNAPGLVEIADLDRDANDLIAWRHKKGRESASFSPGKGEERSGKRAKSVPEKGEDLRPLPLRTPSSTPFPPTEGGRWPRNFVARLVKVWEAQHGKRSAEGDVIAGQLKRLRKARAPWPEVFEAFQRYVRWKEPEWQSPGDFASKWRTWLEPQLSQQELAIVRVTEESEERERYAQGGDHDEF